MRQVNLNTSLGGEDCKTCSEAGRGSSLFIWIYLVQDMTVSSYFVLRHPPAPSPRIALAFLVFLFDSSGIEMFSGDL